MPYRLIKDLKKDDLIEVHLGDGITEEILEVEKGIWRPVRKQWYSYITSEGEVETTLNVSSGQDKYRISQYNCFPSSIEAEHHLEVLKFKAEYREFLEKENGEWQLDWENSEQKKYHVGFNHHYIAITTQRLTHNFDMSWQSFPVWMYAKSGEIIEKAIEKFGDKLKMLFE